MNLLLNCVTNFWTREFMIGYNIYPTTYKHICSSVYVEILVQTYQYLTMYMYVCNCMSKYVHILFYKEVGWSIDIRPHGTGLKMGSLCTNTQRSGS